jgi:DNA-binding response OmpR family regulator
VGMQDAGAISVLIVDDDSRMRNVVRTILEDEGFVVSEAADGSEAIQVASRDRLPNLIVLDVMMPERNGWECLTDLKSHSRLRHIPVILMTSRGEHDDQFRGMAQGADGYIVKPFEPDSLVKAVKATLGHRTTDRDA